MSTAAALVIVYCVATAVAIVVRRIRVPFPVALVLAGLALGSFTRIDPPRLTKDMLFTFFLPGLLFEAAFHLDLRAARKVWRSIVLLAVPGVVLATIAVASLVVGSARLFGLADLDTWRVAILFGAIVAATDPVAVTSVFRELGAPPRLAALIEGESLLNDGTGVVLFSLALAFLETSHISAGAVAGSFVLVAGAGALIGLALGRIISAVIAHVNDPMIEIALTMIAAYGSFVLAESMHVSGVLATVFAGVMCGRHGRDAGMIPSSKLAAETFWRYVAFALNSIVFILLGFDFNATRLRAVWPAIIIAYATMMIARFLVVAALIPFRGSGIEAIPRRWSFVVAWGGLRGALSLVLALAVPADLPQRPLLIAMTIGAVVASVIVQGLSMPFFVKRLAAQSGAES